MSDKINLSFKQRILNLKRGYKLCNTLAPTYIQKLCLRSGLQSAVTYLSILFSGAIIQLITGEMELKKAFLYAVIFSSVNIALNIFYQYLVVSKQQQLEQGFYAKAKNMISQKCMNMDFVKIENPDTHRMKTQAENYFYGSASRWNGMGRILFDTPIIFEAVISIIIGFVMCFNAFFLTPPSAENGVMGFVQSLWGLLAMLAFYGLVIFLNAFMTRRAGRLWSDFHQNKNYLQTNRVLSFYQDFFKNRYQRGKDIRIYNQSEMLLKDYDRHITDDLGYWHGMHRKMLPHDSVPYFLRILLELVTYAFVITRTISGMYSPAEAVVLVMSITKLLNGVNDIIAYKVDFLDIVPLNLQHIFDFLDIPDEKYKGTIPTEKRDDNEYEFEFRHVYFKYPDSEDYVLKDVNLKWRIGEKMALVGKNGCGKSTLVKLLTRLYDPTEGEITLNGIDIRKYKYEEYMALFSVVFQDSKLFSFSLAENVAADTEYDAELVESCVRRAGLSERLDTMENGIETCLYKDFDDKGVEISGGEMQKLCLARAIYKGSPFIVLDEPTAALDPISEHDIYTKFNGIVGTRTAIYISHRLSSCRFCDEITVMDNGRIAERGSHDELLGKGGVYKELWTAQAEYYKDTAGELYA